MSYSKPKNDRAAVRWHDEALANHQRAWDDMHEIGVTLGRDSSAYAEARDAVVLLRGDITRARQHVAARRDWSR